MGGRYASVFVSVLVVMMATGSDVSWAESSTGYNDKKGGVSASVRVMLSVTVNPVISLNVSALAVATDNNVHDTGVSSYSCETANGRILGSGTCNHGGSDNNMVYTVTTL